MNHPWMKAPLCLSASLFMSTMMPNSFACSVFGVNIYSSRNNIVNVIGQRTMDFENGGLDPMIKGLNGTENISVLNVGKIPKETAMTWTNSYKLIEKMLSPAGELLEGINDGGLYAGFLYLPGETFYPLYSSSDSRKALGVFDLVNFILGTSGSVKEGISKLKEIQIVENAIGLGYYFSAPPLHLFLKDKSGDGAVIEFTKDFGMVIYDSEKGDDPNVLTNSPTYDWQIDNYNSVTSNFVNSNTNYTTNGIYANGSGYLGLPGDFTPVSRFVRIKTILHAAPQVKDATQAEYVARLALNAAIVPIGMNPAPTLWYTIFNLGSGDYSYVQIVKIGARRQYIMTDINKEYKYNVKNGLASIFLTSKLSYPIITTNPSKVRTPLGPQNGAIYDSTFRKISP